MNINLKNASIIDCKNNDCEKDINVGKRINFNKKIKLNYRQRGLEKYITRFQQMILNVNIKGQEKFMGMDNFSIQMPVIRGYDRELLVSSLLRKDNLLAPRNFYFKFYINGEYVGIRHIEEAVRKELIEAANYRNGPIFDLDQKEGDIYQLAKFNLIENEKWNQRDNKISIDAMNILNRSKNNPSLFNVYFNNKKWAKYFAYMQAFQTFHGTLPKSIKFYLNPIEGKFEPIFFDGHIDKWNKNTRITDLIFKYSSANDCKNGMIGSDHAVKLCNQIKWYQFLFGESFKNKNFYIEYFNTLEKISSENFIKNTLRNEWDKLSFYRGSLYKEFWRTDEYDQFGLTPYIASWSSLESRLKKIRNEINIAQNIQPSFEYDVEKRKVNILNKRSVLPQIAYICGSKISSPLILIKDKTLKYDLNLIGKCDSKEVYLSLKNQNKKIQISKSRNILQKEITSNYPANFKETNFNKLVLGSNKILNINNDQVISSENIYFPPGSKICLSNKATLTLESKNIFFDSSTRLGGVRIEACDEFGGSLIIRNSNIYANEIFIDKLTSPSNYLTDFLEV